MMNIPENERMTWEEAMKMACEEVDGTRYRLGGCYSESLKALARRIQRTEPRPVDPVLVEVRKIVAEAYRAYDFRMTAASVASGEADNGPTMKAALACFRRGMEWK